MGKKRLLVILGAGSSVEQNMPCVAQIGDLMERWSEAWQHSDPAIPPCDNYFSQLWHKGKIYYKSAHIPFPRRHVSPNFEHILADLMELAHWMMPAPDGNRLRQTLPTDPARCSLFFPYCDKSEPYGNAQLVYMQLGYLLKRLAQHMRQQCLDRGKMLSEGSDEKTVEARDRYQRVIKALRDAFDVGIYNLNYDDVAFLASSGAFTGFDQAGCFSPVEVHSRVKWDFVYHLHGSVHYTLEGPSPDSIRWKDDLSEKFTDGDDGQATKILGERAFPRSTFIAGGFKLDQLLIEPFQSFYSSLVGHAYEADAILLGGYGFGDIHLNRALQNSRLRDNKNAAISPNRVIVLTKDKMRNRDNDWYTAMCRVICHNTDCFPKNGEDASVLGDSSLTKNDLLCSQGGQECIWDGGFLQAEKDIGRIVSWLEGRDI